MNDPYLLAEKLLALVCSGFQAAEVPLPGDDDDHPGVKYVAPGLAVAYDGEQVTTNVTRLFYGQPGAERDSYNPREPMPLSCDLQVMILRATPVQQESGDPPEPTDLSTNAATNVLDMVTLRQVLYDIVQGYELQDRGIPVTLSPVLPIGPQGGLVGVGATITTLLS